MLVNSTVQGRDDNFACRITLHCSLPEHPDIEETDTTKRGVEISGRLVILKADEDEASRHRALSIRVSGALSFARARGLAKEKISQFYDNLLKLLDILCLWDKPSHIFNCDESGLQLTYKPQKIISKHGKRDVVSQTNCEKGDNVSVMACVSSSSHYAPPFVVMKGQCLNENYEIGMPPGTEMVVSDSGYMQ
ncbi:hypothetical protein PR048_023403 [Dryococelus australis]|uniref:DDE Tnp4 domain-containing protein n=1 Tax=Dryococelus australis TaxID=614101 RepID=A0ABQ9GU31_9NEOP|nr:hypothetical protein PR048_023403 [Dryococelus australis]